MLLNSRAVDFQIDPIHLYVCPVSLSEKYELYKYRELFFFNPLNLEFL